MTGNESPASPFFRFFSEAGCAMAVADKDGIIVLSNGRFNSLLESITVPASKDSDEAAAPVDPSGVTQKAGAGAFDFMSIHDSVRFSNLLSQLSRTNKKYLDFRAPFHDSDRNPHWLKIHAWVMSEDPRVDLSDRGPFIGLTLFDETAKHNAEERLHEDVRTAESAVEAKSRFLATMSHEIRTPIQTIIGMTELMRDTQLNREQDEYARQVKFSADVLLSLINDILDYSKIEAGRMELEHVEFDLAEILEQAVEMIAMEAHKKNLELAVDIPLEARLSLLGDPNKFRQVAINLAKNAVKFTREGGITVSVRTHKPPPPADGDADLRHITVSVADTGIGVPEESRGRIFSPFTQADSSHTRLFGGTGLGLAISKNLVDLMKGSIGMKGNEGGGSIFYFTVPFETKPLEAGTPVELFKPQKANARILLVDNNDTSRNIIASYLADAGYTNVQSVSSGKEALEIMRRQSEAGAGYELSFIDMDMPQMDGWRLAAEINADKSINESKLVLMIPHGLLLADAKMTLLKWFDGYINKPITLRRLAETTAIVLAQAEMEALAESWGEASAESLGGEVPADQIPDSAPYTVPADLLVPADLVPPKGDSRDGSGDFFRGEGLLVLVVEDHEVNQQLFALTLAKLGCRTVLAEDGIVGVEKALEETPDIIFMDIQMPRMNGYEAAKELRGMKFSRPIIAVTASSQIDEQQRCMEAGFNDILLKPFKRPEVEGMLSKWTDWAGNSEHPPEAAKQTQFDGNSIFNPRDLMETFMDNEEISRSLLENFIRRSIEQIGTLPALSKEENWQEARRVVHTIKGSSLTLSGKELGNRAGRLELAYKNVDRKEMEAALEPFAEAFARFKDAAEAYLRTK